MSLPISREQAHQTARWMKSNFGEEIAGTVAGTPFSVDLICAMVCQETAYFWLKFRNSLSVDEILARCVLDASGDYPGTTRSPFPRNTAAFRKAYGDDFTEMLISEANKTRELRGMSPAHWVYKGYGILQYDLQFVRVNEAFFRERKWYSFSECLNRCLGELRDCYQQHGDLWKTIKCYNGSGQPATNYANNVSQFIEYCREVKM